MNAIDELLTLLEDHLKILTKMGEDGVDPKDPRCDEWLTSSGIILTGLPYWADLFTQEQRDWVVRLIKEHGPKDA